MADETLLVTLLGGLHLLGFGFAALLLLPCLRDERIVPRPVGRPEEDDGGGGGNDRPRPLPSRGPRDGGLPLPLPDAAPARVRLRERLPAVERRPAHAPAPGQVPGRRVPAKGTY